MKRIKKLKTKKSGTAIELVFDGNKVLGAWYHPKLAKLFCALCKDEKTCTIPCVNINPYCG
jgi:hypothetical protein